MHCLGNTLMHEHSQDSSSATLQEECVKQVNNIFNEKNINEILVNQAFKTSELAFFQ